MMDESRLWEGLNAADPNVQASSGLYDKLAQTWPARAAKSMWEGLMTLPTLPQRSFEASEAMRQGNGYDPGPAVEAALLTMGGSSFAPRGALGAGPVKPLQSEVMAAGEAGSSIEALIAERQAGVAAAAAKRQKKLERDIKAGRVVPGEEVTFAEQQLVKRRAAQQAAEDAQYAAGDVASPNTALGPLDSEVMRLYRSRGGGFGFD